MPNKRRRRNRKRRSSRSYHKPFATNLRNADRTVFYPDNVQSFPYDSYYKKKEDDHPKYTWNSKTGSKPSTKSPPKSAKSTSMTTTPGMIQNAISNVNNVYNSLSTQAQQAVDQAIISLGNDPTWGPTIRAAQNAGPLALWPFREQIAREYHTYMAAPNQYITNQITNRVPQIGQAANAIASVPQTIGTQTQNYVQQNYPGFTPWASTIGAYATQAAAHIAGLPQRMMSTPGDGMYAGESFHPNAH